MLDKATKYKAVGCANKSLHFLQQLKKHVQIGEGLRKHAQHMD
jgi:hypothetical protein